MDARAPALSKASRPAVARGDVELVQFTNEGMFRKARHLWLIDVMRQGDTQVLAVCFALSSYFGFRSGGTAWVDQHRLAADLGCDVRTVGRWIRKAVDRGWLSTQRRANTTSIYRMSRSRSVMASVELEHENRTTEFVIESERRRLDRAARGSDSSVGSVQTDLPDTFGQDCRFGSDTSVGLSTVIPTAIDPSIRSTERLGDEEHRFTLDEPEQKKALLHDVISELGRGDLVEGQRIADALGSGQLDWLVAFVDDAGVDGARSAIAAARNSAAPQH